MAYKIYFLRNFLITKLRKFELQSCIARKLQSCPKQLQRFAEITKLCKVITKLHRNYKVAQKLQSCAEHLALRDLFKIGLSFAALQYNYRPSNILQKEFQSNPA